MLITELKELLKGYHEEELRTLITQMYKMMPKNLREIKEVDELLKNVHSPGKTNETGKIMQKRMDINSLRSKVELFVDYAYQQYYCLPNRYVQKKDRPQWRFIVKAYLKELQQYTMDSQEGQVATELLVKLYEMLCYGCGYYIFNTENPFRSIRMDQIELLNTILNRMLTCGINNTVISSAIRLTINNRSNGDIIDSFLIATLVANIKSPEARELALLEAMNYKKKLDSKNASLTKGKYNMSIAEYEHNERINNVVELIFVLNVELCEYEEGIRYYKQNRLESNKEVSLYLLLELLEENNLVDLWKREYEEAVKKSIKPREILNIKYKFINEHGRIPCYEEYRSEH